jgi:hypothetical protein
VAYFLVVGNCRMNLQAAKHLVRIISEIEKRFCLADIHDLETNLVPGPKVLVRKDRNSFRRSLDSSKRKTSRRKI